MHTRFLDLWQQLNTAMPFATKGIWLIHTDEPLLCQWLIAACRPHWQAHGQLYKRYELLNSNSWQDVLHELNSLSLFDEHTALVVTGKHKPDQKTLNELKRFAQDTHDGTLNTHLLWCLPKQDKKSLASKTFKTLEEQGLIIDGVIHHETERAAILHAQAGHLNLFLDDTAWQMLLSYTEHNLLSAYQTLWRLSYLHPNQVISTEQLTDTLADGAQFDIFNLSDSLLQGNLAKSLKIIHHLQHTDTATSLILWLLNKELDIIRYLQAGKTTQELNIWQSKASLYHHAAKRTQTVSTSWERQLYQLDQAIKGVSAHNVWHLITQLVVSLCSDPNSPHLPIK